MLTGEDFAVYIVLPMWPEGVPSEAAPQEILAFQFETIEMVRVSNGECILQITEERFAFLGTKFAQGATRYLYVGLFYWYWSEWVCANSKLILACL